MIYILKQDGVEKFRSNNENETMAWVHKHHSYSWDWAVKYKKFTIETICSECEQPVDEEGETKEPCDFPECCQNSDAGTCPGDCGLCFCECHM